MEGYGADKGVSPRAVAELFSIVDSSKKDISYTLTFSMLEIYNESILDLLDNSPNKVRTSACVRACVCVYVYSVPCVGVGEPHCAPGYELGVLQNTTVRALAADHL